MRNAAKPEIMANLSRVREPYNVNGLAQAAAIASLKDDEHLQRSIQMNDQGREYLTQVFQELGLSSIPSQANFVLVDVKSSAERVSEALLRLGVLVRSAHVFNLATFLRVTVGTEEQNKRLVQALKEVLARENRH